LSMNAFSHSYELRPLFSQSETRNASIDHRHASILHYQYFVSLQTDHPEGWTKEMQIYTPVYNTIQSRNEGKKSLLF
jgi:hypothetical protein